MANDYEDSDAENELLDTSRRELGWWGQFWGAAFGLLALAATTINLLQGIFHFELIPAIGNTLDEFRRLLHWALDTVLFSWIALFFENAIQQLGFAPPHLVIPGWYKDLALVSIVISRAANRAASFSDIPSLDFVDESRRAVRQNLGVVGLGAILAMNALTNAVEFVLSLAAKVLAFPFLLFGARVANFVLWRIEDVLRGAVLLSLVHLFLNTIELLFGAPPDRDRRWLGWQYFSLTMATVAAMGFFVWNGYVLEYFR